MYRSIAGWFLYTDGVSEANDANDEQFGEERMLEALNSSDTDNPGQLLEHVRQKIDEFVGDAPQFDDLTMLAFTYYGKEGL